MSRIPFLLLLAVTLTTAAAQNVVTNFESKSSARP